jgi:hypothetical protein
LPSKTFQARLIQENSIIKKSKAFFAYKNKNKNKNKTNCPSNVG